MLFYVINSSHNLRNNGQWLCHFVLSSTAIELVEILMVMYSFWEFQRQIYWSILVSFVQYGACDLFVSACICLFNCLDFLDFYVTVIDFYLLFQVYQTKSNSLSSQVYQIYDARFRLTEYFWPWPQSDCRHGNFLWVSFEKFLMHKLLTQKITSFFFLLRETSKI